MITAAVSVRASTKRRTAAAAAPTTSRFGPPPGRPNITVVPASASAVTIAAAPAGAPWPLWVTEVPSPPGVDDIIGHLTFLFPEANALTSLRYRGGDRVGGSGAGSSGINTSVPNVAR